MEVSGFKGLAVGVQDWVTMIGGEPPKCRVRDFTHRGLDSMMGYWNVMRSLRLQSVFRRTVREITHPTDRLHTASGQVSLVAR